MQVSTDSKHIKVRLYDIEMRLLYNKIIKRYGYTSSASYNYVIRDKNHGVYLFHHPKAPYMNFTTSLIFQGYSNGSQLLRDIFDLIPLSRWRVRRMDIAFDSALPYDQLHAVHPHKRADVKAYEDSIYLGGHSSPAQLHMYDKQAQLREVKGIITDTWARVEMRYRFEPMKRVSELHMDDFKAAMDYWIITDIRGMPQKIQDIVRQLNRGDRPGGMIWSQVTRTNQTKIREYAAEQGLNLYQLILSDVGDIKQFIYSPNEARHIRNISI